MPDGATFVAAATQFQITYQGGDGNDVVLTQLTDVTPPQFGSITKLANGQVQLNGSGLAGVTYIVQANDNLTTANWVIIGSATAAQNDALTFTDPNAPSFPARFYRFLEQ